MSTGIIVPVAFFATIFGIYFIYFKTRNKERLALIEKGYDAELFNQNKKENLTFWTLRLGFLIFGFGLGLFVGSLLEHNYPDKDEFIGASIFIFSGLFWIIEFAIERKIIKSDKEAGN